MRLQATIHEAFYKKGAFTTLISSRSKKLLKIESLKMKKIIAKTALAVLVATTVAPVKAEENKSKLALVAGLVTLAGGSLYYLSKHGITKTSQWDSRYKYYTPGVGLLGVSLVGLLALLNPEKN